MVNHQYAEASTQFHKLLASDPSFEPAHFYVSEFDAVTGHFADALSELKKFTSPPGTFSPDAQGYNQAMLAAQDKFADPANVALSFAIPVIAARRSNTWRRPSPNRTSSWSASFAFLPSI